MPTKTAQPTAKQLALVHRCVKAYRDAGFNPVPSRMDSKRPLIKFADYWTKPLPEDIFQQIPTTNVQVMTGRHWGLVVFDLDGPEAVAAWPKLAKDTPRTWVTHSGNGGEHWWYRIRTKGLTLRKAEVWRPTWPAPRAKGDVAIERLGDKSLVVAPPSIHPTTGRMYKFKSRYESPAGMPAPAFCPDWILGLPVLVTPKPEIVTAAPKIALPLNERKGTATARFAWRDVLDAIPSKIALAQGWGLRIAGQQPGPKGWISCRSIRREDRSASCSFNEVSGYYVDFVSHEKLSLFELGVELGWFQTWSEAVEVLGAAHCPHLQRSRLVLPSLPQDMSNTG